MKKQYKIDNLMKEASIFNYQTIKEAIIKMNKSTLQAVIVLDKKKKYLGTITDGDIRRGLLKKISIEETVEKIVRKKTYFVSIQTSRNTAIKIMEEKQISHLPIINKKQEFVGLHLKDDVFSKVTFPNPILIMAGGFGKRMRPYTLKIPKPMLLLQNKTMLEHVIKRFRKERFKNFYISLHYLGNKIKDHFGNGSRLNVNIKYITETKPLGTAGSIGSIKEKFKEPLIVCNADVISNLSIIKMIEFHKKNKSFATMAVKQYEFKTPFGVVKTNGINIKNFTEKPVKRDFVNAGVYLFEPQIVKLVGKNSKIDIPDLFKFLKNKKKKSIIYPIHEHWFDVGRAEDYKAIKKVLNE